MSASSDKVNARPQATGAAWDGKGQGLPPFSGAGAQEPEPVSTVPVVYPLPGDDHGEPKPQPPFGGGGAQGPSTASSTPPNYPVPGDGKGGGH